MTDTQTSELGKSPDGDRDASVIDQWIKDGRLAIVGQVRLGKSADGEADAIGLLANRLRERLKLKYSTNCKCGNCQAVYINDLVEAIDFLEWFFLNSERDTRPKDGDALAAPLASSPVTEGHSPDIASAIRSPDNV